MPLFSQNFQSLSTTAQEQPLRDPKLFQLTLLLEAFIRNQDKGYLSFTFYTDNESKILIKLMINLLLLLIQDEEDPKNMERLSNKELLIQNIDYAIDMFLIYVLTLSIFPGFLSEDTGKHSLGGW